MIKKIIIYILALIIIFSACTKDNTGKDGITPEEQTCKYDKLSDFDYDKFPSEGNDEWVIIDTIVNNTDFIGLKKAILSLSSTDREISVVFKNIENLPDSSLYFSEKGIKALHSIDFPKAQKIGASAFEGCSSTKKISINAAEIIEIRSFKNCTSLEELNLSKEKELKIFGDSVSDIFLNSKPLNEIKLTIGGENSKYIIKSEARLDLRQISSKIYGPFKSINNIEAEPTSPLTNLNEYSKDSYPKENIWTINNEVAERADFKGLFDALISLNDTDREITLVFPNLVKMPYSAFFQDMDKEVKSLVSIELPVAKKIQSTVFKNCKNLRKAIMPKASSLGYGVFNSCINLTYLEVALESTLESFGDEQGDVFINGNKLSNIDLKIGESHKLDIEKGLFTAPVSWGEPFTYGPFKTINGTAPSSSEIPFSYLKDYGKASFPADSDIWTILDESASSEDFAGLKNAIDALYMTTRRIKIIMPNLKVLPNKAFASREQNLEKLIAIEIPELEIIGESAFDLTVISEFDFPKVTKVGGNAFNYCDSLIKLSLPKVDSIGSFAIYGCDKLPEINFPLLKKVGWKAFADNPKLKKANLPILEEIDQAGLFNSCTSLEEIELPKLKILPSVTFSKCTSLKIAKLPIITNIGSGAFDSCSSLSELEIANDSKLLEFGSESKWGGVLDDVPLEKVTLKIGKENQAMINIEGKIFKAPVNNGSRDYGPFKAIIILD